MENNVLDEIKKEKSPSVFSAAWPAGIICAFYNLLFSYLEKFVLLEYDMVYWFTSLILSFILFIIISRHARKQNFEFLTYWKALGLSFMIYFIAFVICHIIFFIFYDWFFEEIYSSAMNAEISSIQSDPVLSDEEKAFYVNETRGWFVKSNMLFLSLIFNVLVSIPYCFLAAIFVMKKRKITTYP